MATVKRKRKNGISVHLVGLIAVMGFIGASALYIQQFGIEAYTAAVAVAYVVTLMFQVFEDNQ